MLDPFDVYDHFIKGQLPREWQIELGIPSTWGLAAFVLLILWAAILTYHAAAASKRRLEGIINDQERRLALKDLVGDAIGKLQAIYILDKENHQAAIARANYVTELIIGLISESVGTGEAKVFMSNEGLVSFGGGKDEVRIHIERRVRRLSELMVRLDGLSINSSLNLDNWIERMGKA